MKINLKEGEEFVVRGDALYLLSPVEVEYEKEEKEHVPQHVTADHIESLCNLLDFCLPRVSVSQMPHEKYQRYEDIIQHAREHAQWLRTGKT